MKDWAHKMAAAIVVEAEHAGRAVSPKNEATVREEEYLRLISAALRTYAEEARQKEREVNAELAAGFWPPTWPKREWSGARRAAAAIATAIRASREGPR